MVMQIWQTILEWSEDKKRALSMLWGSHLRFFRQLVSTGFLICPVPLRLPRSPTSGALHPILLHCEILNRAWAWGCCSCSRKAEARHKGPDWGACGAADGVQGGLYRGFCHQPACKGLLRRHWAAEHW